MKRNLVLDTNALVSAALSEDSVSGRAFRKAITTFSIVMSSACKDSVSGRVFRKAITTFSIVMSSACFDELVEVILRPKFRKYLDIRDALDFVDNYKNMAALIPIIHSVTDCRDPKDDKFLDLALAASAQYIITGDTDLLVLHPYHDIEIITPADFLAL